MLLLSAPGVNVIAPLVGGLIEGQVSISVCYAIFVISTIIFIR